MIVSILCHATQGAKVSTVTVAITGHFRNSTINHIYSGKVLFNNQARVTLAVLT
jgi:hypothetical protein